MCIGNRIKKAIQKSEFSVKEIADKLGVTPQNMYKMFQKKSVDSKHLLEIVKILKIDPNSLLQFEIIQSDYSPQSIKRKSELDFTHKALELTNEGHNNLVDEINSLYKEMNALLKELATTKEILESYRRIYGSMEDNTEDLKKIKRDLKKWNDPQ